MLYNENSEFGHKSLKQEAIKAVKKASEYETTPPILGEGVSIRDATAAKKVSLVCQGKVEEEFNSSQLLGAGAVIDLHARKYLINFNKKRKDGSKISLGALECKIGIPTWARAFKNTEEVYDKVMSAWLDEAS